MELIAEPAGHCLLTRGLTRLDLPVRHGEGKLVCEPEVLERLEGEGLAALRYGDGKGGRAKGVFPANPNGSLADIAGLTDATGRGAGPDAPPRGLLPPEPASGLDPVAGRTSAGRAGTWTRTGRAPGWRSSSTRSRPPKGSFRPRGRRTPPEHPGPGHGPGGGCTCCCAATWAPPRTARPTATWCWATPAARWTAGSGDRAEELLEGGGQRRPGAGQGAGGELPRPESGGGGRVVPGRRTRATRPSSCRPARCRRPSCPAAWTSCWPGSRTPTSRRP